jgi:hypothetical protein
MQEKYLRISHPIFLLVAACIMLMGCAGIDLPRDSSELSGGYAKATNQQMLLNLARLQNDDPPYFLQLSNITSQDVLSGSAQFSPSNSNTLHSTAQTAGGIAGLGPSTWTLGGMAQGSVAQNPTFTFVPLNGDTLSQLISVPMAQNLFYEFIIQDVPIDLVARIMVGSMDVPVKKLAGTATFKGFDGQGKMLFGNSDSNGYDFFNAESERIDTDRLKADRAKLNDDGPNSQSPIDDDNRVRDDLDKIDIDKQIEKLVTENLGQVRNQIMPIQDQAGYYLGANGDRVLDRNGNYTDKYGNLVYDDHGKPQSAVNGNQKVEVYIPSTHRLENDPFASTYKDFLAWCHNQYILQKYYLLSVETKPAGESNKNDQIYNIQNLKLADLVSAKAAGYEVTPADTQGATSGNNYIVKKTTSISYTFKVDQADKVKTQMIAYSKTFNKLLRYTSMVANFGKTTTGVTRQEEPASSFQDLSLDSNANYSDTESPTESVTNPNNLVFNFRTFLGVLRGVAMEQLFYKDHPDFFEIGARQAKSILTLEMPHLDESDYDILIYQSYHGKDYYIADSRDTADPATPHDFFTQQNKCVFTILTLLYADVTLDPTKLQQPIQVIQ